VTGYFFFDSNFSYQPPTELQNFLESGEPPVCISFGSMVNRDAEKIDSIVREALKRTSHRGIILSGWGGVKQSSTKDLLYHDSAPHDWLFPRCKMVIHHGGAGTTSAGLRAGIPNIVIPFTADQPFWGKRVHAIGAGPRPILVRKLSADNLCRAIVEEDDPLVRKRAQAVGQSIGGEDGVGQAVGLIESHVSSWVNFKV
jgi:sterol 3beta-glucosyltransferase